MTNGSQARSSASDLVDELAPEAGELAVVSLVLTDESSPDGKRVPRLLRGSICIAPKAAGAGNWYEWQSLHGESPVFEQEPKSANYVSRAGKFSTWRIVAAVDQMSIWLSELVSSGHCSDVGGLPGISAILAPPSAPIRISTHLSTPASTFLTSVIRPGTGYYFPSPTEAIDAPGEWSDGGQSFPNSPLAVGLPILPEVPLGLVLARLERRAWFNRLSGGESLETFDLHIGLEPSRIDVADLNVTLDEWIDDELVTSQQVSLDSMAIDDVRGSQNIVVHLPTLGPKVQRSTRLHDRAGTLLDCSADRFRIVERIGLSVGLLDQPAIEPTATTIGIPDRYYDLVARSTAVDRVKREYRSLFETGAEGSLLPDTTDGRITMRNRLAQARGVLQIVDRYFGKSIDDWTMISSVGIPIEVLATPHGGTPPNGSRVRVRHYLTRPIPFHGRAYLWEGGGYSVDASPDAFGRNLVFVTSLRSEVSDLWRTWFATWWAQSSPVN